MKHTALQKTNIIIKNTEWKSTKMYYLYKIEINTIKSHIQNATIRMRAWYLTTIEYNIINAQYKLKTYKD